MRSIAFALAPAAQASTLASTPTSSVLGEPLDKSIDHLTGETRRQWLQLEQDLLAEGIEAQVRSTLRTCAQQDELYGVGRGGEAVVRLTSTCSATARLLAKKPMLSWARSRKRKAGSGAEISQDFPTSGTSNGTPV